MVVDRDPERRVGAAVLAVVHAVLVAVGRTALGVDAFPSWGPGAPVETVVDAIAVGIAGTPGGVHLGPLRRVRALVASIGDAVSVAIALDHRLHPGRARGLPVSMGRELAHGLPVHHAGL